MCRMRRLMHILFVVALFFPQVVFAGVHTVAALQET